MDTRGLAPKLQQAIKIRENPNLTKTKKFEKLTRLAATATSTTLQIQISQLKDTLIPPQGLNL